MSSRGLVWTFVLVVSGLVLGVGVVLLAVGLGSEPDERMMRIANTGFVLVAAGGGAAGVSAVLVVLAKRGG